MFYLLCAAVCLAVLFITIAATLLVSSGGAWLLRRYARSTPPALLCNLVFVLRLLPVVAGIFFVAGFALPSFLRFEPRSTSEDVGPRLILLSLLGAVVVWQASVRWYRIYRATSQAEKQWLDRAEKLSLSHNSAPVYAVERTKGLVAVLGVFRR